MPNAEEQFVKAQLVFKIDTLMKEGGLKQIEAAGLFGICRPDVSKMLRGGSGSFPLGAFSVFSWRSIRMSRSS